MKKIQVQDFTISSENKPFIIAEMSGNHNQSLERALEIIDAAAAAGGHAIKIQTSSPDMLTIDSSNEDFIVRGSNPDWEAKTLYNLYQEVYTPFEWHEAIFKRAKEKNIIAFSSPFGLEAVDFLETLDCPMYKIASFENNFIQLIEKVALTGKPVIISTGMANLETLQDIIDLFARVNNPNLILLKCTSTYPASAVDSNLLTIPHMESMFDCIIGLSDHTLGIGVAVAATALGARVIEKHFTLNRKDGGLDASFSLEPHEFKSLVEETEKAFDALGKVTYGITTAEQKSITFRRSIYVVEDIKEGEVFTSTNIRVIRPGKGLLPKFYNNIIGKTSKQDISKGTALSWNNL
ncbi:pseudaminic acid synthase [Bernardetia sp. Wsw4-3y2]|uniref:pseudaminic acid synthase n=1 Tax=Bernardetia sp. Wsw4-3y2 TaxID=3127471 RepID=UPI0030D36E52